MDKMDKIELQGIACSARIGVSDEERSSEQILHVDLNISLDLTAAGRSDDLEETLDYEEVVARVERIGAARSYNLIERFAYLVASEVLGLPEVQSVSVRVRKLPDTLTARVEHAAVLITRSRVDFE